MKNILILELFEMGAAIMAYPAVRHLKKQYPEANIYCLCTDTVKQSWEILNILPASNILDIKSKTLFQFGVSLLARIRQLRKIKIDLAVDFELFMRIPAIILFMTGARRKAGFYRYEMEGLYRGDFYDHRVAFNQNLHITKNFLALAMTAAGGGNHYPNLKSAIILDSYDFPVYHSQKDINEIIKRKIRDKYPSYKGEPLILLSPDVGKNLSVRNYPKEYFAEVMKKILSAKPDHLALIIGVKDDWPVCDWIEKEVNRKNCVNFCGQTASIQELLELMSFSTLLIGNDNGPLHFASMTDCKILGLFSTDSPFIYGPLGNCVAVYQFYHCSPCISAFNHKRSRCKKNLCLSTLDPAVVADYALKVLEGKVKYRTINNEIPYIF